MLFFQPALSILCFNINKIAFAYPMIEERGIIDLFSHTWGSWRVKTNDKMVLTVNLTLPRGTWMVNGILTTSTIETLKNISDAFVPYIEMRNLRDSVRVGTKNIGTFLFFHITFSSWKLYHSFTTKFWLSFHQMSHRKTPSIKWAIGKEIVLGFQHSSTQCPYNPWWCLVFYFIIIF